MLLFFCGGWLLLADDRFRKGIAAASLPLKDDTHKTAEAALTTGFEDKIPGQASTPREKSAADASLFTVALSSFVF